MTQTPLQQEEAAATAAAGADLEAPSPAPAEPKTYQAEPWVEPAGSQPPPESGRAGGSLAGRLARAPLVGLGVLAGGALVGTAATLMLARAARRRRPFAHARRMVGRL